MKNYVPLCIYNIAESLGASEQRRAADNLAAFCGGQANSYRKAMDALQQAKKKGHKSCIGIT